MTSLRGATRWLAIAGALIVCASASAAGPPSAWTEWGNGPQRWGNAPSNPPTVTRRFVLPLAGRITDQVLAANGSFYVATSTGKVVAFSPDGLVRWQVDVGQLSNVCAQLDGYGVTGTGVIDPATSTLYVADAFGRLHALALGNGAERPGWPVRVFTDDRKELVWGALSLVQGAVYVPTASYCDAPMTGGIYRVDLSSHQVTSWISVPASLGGGGGVWGWGGTAWSPAQNNLYAVTANALSGGSNVGASFSESAGYGEQLVELAPDLTVDGASHPADITSPQDLDFVGSPIVLDRSGCGELVVGADKNDELYGWRAADVAAGPIWDLQLEPFNPANPLLSQLAWSPSLASLYAVTGTQLVRIAIGANCSPTIAWRRPLGTNTENGSPTIAGTTVWFAVNGKPALDGYDARTGKRMFQAPLGGTTLVAPTILNGRLIVGTFTGIVEGFTFNQQRTLSSAGQSPAATSSAVSWAGSRDAWESRSTGVYATEDADKTWHEIYPEPAMAVLRLSRTAGLIEIGISPGPCMCTTRKLWTSDGGRSWHETNAVSGDFTGSGRDVYWWEGGSLHIITGFPPEGTREPLHSQLVISLPDGTIAGKAQIPYGIAVLVSSRVNGHKWDGSPRVLIVHGDNAETLRLPMQRGQILVEQIQSSWPNLTVTGTDFGADPVAEVTWASSDGGNTWSTGS